MVVSRCISHIAFTTRERYFPSGRPFYIGFLVKRADEPYGDLSEIRTHDYQLERLASYPFRRRDHFNAAAPCFTSFLQRRSGQLDGGILGIRTPLLSSLQGRRPLLAVPYPIYTRHIKRVITDSNRIV